MGEYEQTRETPGGWLAVVMRAAAVLLGPIWLSIVVMLMWMQPSWFRILARVPFLYVKRAIWGWPAEIAYPLGLYYTASSLLFALAVVLLPTVLIGTGAAVFYRFQDWYMAGEERGARRRFERLAGDVRVHADAWETDRRDAS